MLLEERTWDSSARFPWHLLVLAERPDPFENLKEEIFICTLERRLRVASKSSESPPNVVVKGRE
jgi:hypothetical protein